MKKTRLQQLLEDANRNNTNDGHVLSREEKLSLWISHVIPQSCIFLLEKDTSVINYHYDIPANVSPMYFENGLYMEEMLAEYRKLPDGETFCIIIHNIDDIDVRSQYIFNGIVKDRVYNCTDKLPEKVQIVITLSKSENRVKINQALWNLGQNLLDW